MAVGSTCPICRTGHLSPTNLPGRYRCDQCLRRVELVSVCPNCGEHATIATSITGPAPTCNHCGTSLLRSVLAGCPGRALRPSAGDRRGPVAARLPIG